MNTLEEMLRLRASLEELARFGCPVDLSVAAPTIQNQAIEIEQVGGITEAQFFQTASNRVACIVDVAITNLRSRPIDIVGAYLRPDWDDMDFEWLLPFESKFKHHAKRTRSIYEFGSSGPTFSNDEVLNHHLVARKRLPGGRCLEGLLLAQGGFMPEGIRHGEWHGLSLTIVTSDHREYSATFRLWTERLSVRVMPKARQRLFVTDAMETDMPAGISPMCEDETQPLPAPIATSSSGVSSEDTLR